MACQVSDTPDWALPAPEAIACYRPVARASQRSAEDPPRPMLASLHPAHATLRWACCVGRLGTALSPVQGPHSVAALHPQRVWKTASCWTGVPPHVYGRSQKPGQEGQMMGSCCCLLPGDPRTLQTGQCNEVEWSRLDMQHMLDGA